MFIPFVPRVTVVNKNIIYSDTVLPLKEAGNSLNVSSITGVTENDLENCLKVIFKANPDVVFNTIQYSRQNKKLYFYTDKKINTQAYEDSKTQTFRPVRSRVEILEEVKRILTSEKSSDPELISLYNEFNVTGGSFIAPMRIETMPDDKKPSACIGCRSCEAVCPQNIKISEAMTDFTNKLNG